MKLVSRYFTPILRQMLPLNPTAQAVLTRMPTPSLVSDSSGTSPSKVRSLFEGWMNRARVAEVIRPSVEITVLFDKLYQLEEVPSILVQGHLPTPIYDHEADFQRIIRAWASGLRPAEGDEYGIIGVLPTLALAYSCVCKSSNNLTKKHGQRRAFDEIINIAFSARADRHCDFKTEESYRLLAMNTNPDAQSDALVTIPSTIICDIIHTHRLSFTDPTIVNNLYWSTTGFLGDFSIIGFAAEFKRDDAEYNKNQLMMVLTTAQSHRKALGLNKSIIMGAIGCRGRVQIYSSYWKSDYSLIHIYAHKQQFDLSDPTQVLHLYIFYSKLEKHFKDTLASELVDWTAPDEISVKNTKWRSNNRVRKGRSTEAGDSARGGSGGGGDNDGHMETDGFDDNDSTVDADGPDDGCNWFAKVTKWRDESAEDRKEAVSIQGMDEMGLLQRQKYQRCHQELEAILT